MKKLFVLVLIAATSVLMDACTKSNDSTINANGTATVTAMMQGGAITNITNVSNVNLEVTGLQINSDKDGWLSFTVKDNTFDMLTLQGATMVTLGTVSVSANSNVTQIRLILGKNNTIKVGDTTYNLAL